jgi:hypothetical protein
MFSTQFECGQATACQRRDEPRRHPFEPSTGKAGAAGRRNGFKAEDGRLSADGGRSQSREPGRRTCARERRQAYW